MPSQMLTSGVEQELGRKVEELTRELDEAHRREAATAEVLRVISRSMSEAKPVFDIIAASALRLVNAQYVGVMVYDGEVLHLAALHNSNPEAAEAIRRAHPRRPDDSSSAGRAIRFRGPIQIPDALEDPTYELKNVGFRSVLSVPMLRNNEPIGVIAVGRDQPGPFSERQIALLQTFADQAVIAIENARLFEAEQASKRELSEALEYQTATSEVLGVISRSPSDLKPVLLAIAETAGRLCGTDDVGILLRENDQLRFTVNRGSMAALSHVLPLGRASVSGRTVMDGVPIHVHDLQAEEREYPLGYEIAKRYGHRTALGIPLMRDGSAIGCIFLRHTVIRPFTDRQIDLLKTFADQAVIAIENTRLFEEVQARTKELQDSLDRQTATSEVLGVISRSPNEVQPVLDTIAATAQTLCQAERAIVWRLEGETFRAVAHHGLPEERVESVLSPTESD